MSNEKRVNKNKLFDHFRKIVNSSVDVRRMLENSQGKEDVIKGETLAKDVDNGPARSGRIPHHLDGNAAEHLCNVVARDQNAGNAGNANPIWGSGKQRTDHPIMFAHNDGVEGANDGPIRLGENGPRTLVARLTAGVVPSRAAIGACVDGLAQLIHQPLKQSKDPPDAAPDVCWGAEPLFEEALFEACIGRCGRQGGDGCLDLRTQALLSSSQMAVVGNEARYVKLRVS